MNSLNLKSDKLSINYDGSGFGRKLAAVAAVAVPAVVGIMLLTACYKVVMPGYVGIVVKQSGSDRGVQYFPVRTGRVWYNPINEVVLTYPVFVQRAIWSSSLTEGQPVNDEISFQSAEGLRFTADVNASYQLKPEGKRTMQI